MYTNNQNRNKIRLKGFQVNTSRSVRKEIYPSERGGWFMPIIIPNDVHIHQDPVSDYLHASRKQSEREVKQSKHAMNVRIVRKATLKNHCTQK